MTVRVLGGPLCIKEIEKGAYVGVCDFGGKIVEVLVRGLDGNSPGFVTFLAGKVKAVCELRIRFVEYFIGVRDFWRDNRGLSKESLIK